MIFLGHVTVVDMRSLRHVLNSESILYDIVLTRDNIRMVKQRDHDSVTRDINNVFFA